jgi:hypothetical protein
VGSDSCRLALVGPFRKQQGAIVSSRVVRVGVDVQGFPGIRHRNQLSERATLGAVSCAEDALISEPIPLLQLLHSNEKVVGYLTIAGDSRIKRERYTSIVSSYTGEAATIANTAYNTVR